MNEISLRRAVVGFAFLFVVPPILLQPFRPMIVQAVSLPEPTLWQSFGMFLGQILVFGLAAYAYNQRQRIKELEREVEQQKYHMQSNIGD